MMPKDDTRGVSPKVLVDELDPVEIAALPDPFPLVNQLREECPVAHSSTHGGFWNLFRFDDVRAAAVDQETYLSRDVTIPSKNVPVPPPPIMTDPPIHKDFRRPFLSRFSPKAVARLEPAIRASVDELIDGFIERGEADLSSELFVPFPAFAALGILGLPRADLPKFSRWARLAFTPGANYGVEMAEYFSPMYDDLADSEADDLTTLARNLMIDGRPIDRQEFILLLGQLVAAGLDTTTNSAAHIALILSERPELRDRILRDPDLVGTAIEEFLRYVTPVPMLARTTTRDVEFNVNGHCVTVPEGSKVALQYLAANHDPAQFPDPEELRLDRFPNHHLAFGFGPHLCLGMHLARLQLRIVLEEMLRRFPDWSVRSDDVVHVGGFTRIIKSLPVRFTPGEREG